MQVSMISPVIKSNSRGARFLDLVKQNKLNVSPQLSKRLSTNKAIIKDLMGRKKEEAAAEKNEYLKFSDAVPNPNSSPSSSILSKRKVEHETPDSPMGNSAKRKRVSFNDPVSTTKEYLISEEEERHKSNSLIRCLVYDENTENGEDVENSENKENIKIEVDKIDIIKVESDIDPDTVKEERPEIAQYEVKDHDYYEKDENPQNTDITTSSIEDIPDQLSAEEEEEEVTNENNEFSFRSKAELMDYVAKNISVEELLENITQRNEEKESAMRKVIQSINLNDILNEKLPLPDSKHSALAAEEIEATSCIINHISRMMKVNDKVKYKVLDTLSEQHSKSFLTHALQENSTSHVCERLTMPNIINYIIHKVNVCDDDDEISFETNRMNRNIMHTLVKKTSDTREIIVDQKETQELLKLLFLNKQKIDVLDTVHEFLRSNIIQGQF